MDSHALGGQTVVGADDFEVELRADPHGVGVDQLLHHEGAAKAATGFIDGKVRHFTGQRAKGGISHLQLVDQILGC